jgi:tRNA-Thr(GGU) m(6)t(6)A37 methyltransferase TsaA
MKLTSVGIIHSPFRTPDEAPRQGAYTEEISTIEVYEEFLPALKGLDRFTHIIVLYWADRAARDVLESRRHQRPGQVRGIFATRSPARPNPILQSVCKIVEIKGNTLRVRGLEAIDGSPLLDIKPYVPGLDSPSP